MRSRQQETKKIEYPEDVEVDVISDTEEQDERSTDLVDIRETEPQLPESSTNVRVLG